MINGLEIIKQLDRKLFFEKGIPIELLPKKKPLFSITFLEKVLSGISVSGTTFEERVEIVQYCIKHSHNYSETAKKFHISYQQARSYTIRYEENGVDGLQDKRGKRKSPEEMTEVEKLRAEIEISFLKKLEEIERRGG